MTSKRLSIVALAACSCSFALLACGAPPPARGVQAPRGDLASVGAGTVSSASSPPADPMPADPPPPPETENAVTLAMLHALGAEKGNLFFSAVSLRAALGMTALGARGATLDELTKALALDPNPAKNAAAANAERLAWKSAAGRANLAIANRLWVEKVFPLDATFLANADGGYGASPAAVDFLGAPDASRTTINRWVSDATATKIKDLLPPGSVTPLTRLVLTNAVYFKGSWAEAFLPTRTTDAPFHAEGGDVTARTMHRRGLDGLRRNGARPGRRAPL